MLTKFRAINKFRSKESEKSLQTIGKIEDRAKRNYFKRFDDSNLHEFIENAFVINKPMSAVGGDGYWFYQKDDVLYVAAFDCMGHGHLASMMTRIYTSSLEKLVKDHNIEFPASILQFIHREIQSRFVNKKNIMVGTGADLGIVKIIQSENKMEYAGAKVDLMQIQNGELEIIKGDRMQIGEMFDYKHDYHSNTIDLSTKRRYYFGSDGLKDLIGGPSNKKLGASNMKQMLMDVQHLSMRDQKKEIELYMDKWRKSNSQNDDILLIGFEI